MQNPICFPRWALVAFLSAVAVTGRGQTTPVNPVRSVREFPVVTEGRSVSLFADGAVGAVQWQISTGANPAWFDLVDSSTYHGSRTNELEITGVRMDMKGFRYRFTDTVGGTVVESKIAWLAVSPLVFPYPAGLAVDPNGNLIVSDSSMHTLRIIDVNPSPKDRKDGKSVFELAGASGLAGFVDGAGAGARFNQPAGLAWSELSDVIVADAANGTIRRVRGKTVTTLAGSGSERGNRDGAGSAATFSDPMGVAKGPDGSFYVADSGNHTIRKIGADGTVGTFAGSPGNAGWVDGAGQAARFNRPTGIVVDLDGTVYVSDTVNNLIRKITPAGVVTTLAGVPGVAGAEDGPGDRAMFNGPTGLAIQRWHSDDYTGYEKRWTLQVADTGNSTIRSIDADGKVTTRAGLPTVSGLSDFYGRRPNHWGLFNQPRALAWDDSSGSLYIADTGNAAIRVISEDYGMKTMTLSEGKEPDPIPASKPTVPASGGGGSGSAGKSGSGGGSIGGWLVAALADAWLLRKSAAGMRR